MNIYVLEWFDDFRTQLENELLRINKAQVQNYRFEKELAFQ